MTGQQTTQIPMLRIPRNAHPVPTTARLRSARMPVWAYALVIIAVFAGSIVVARDLGWFTTTGRGSTSWGAAEAPGSRAASGTEAGQGSGSEQRVAPTAGAAPDDVKGWMSIQQVLDAFPVTQQALYERFGIAAGTDPGTALKDLAESSGFDIPELRTWLGEQTG